MTIAIYRLHLGRELGTCSPTLARDLASQPGVAWCRVRRVVWRRALAQGLVRRG